MTLLAIIAISLFASAILGWALAERRVGSLIAANQGLVAANHVVTKRARDAESTVDILLGNVAKRASQHADDQREIDALRAEVNRLWLRNCDLRTAEIQPGPLTPAVTYPIPLRPPQHP